MSYLALRMFNGTNAKCNQFKLMLHKIVSFLILSNLAVNKTTSGEPEYLFKFQADFDNIKLTISVQK